jgi:hypothetical protein
VAPRRPRPSQHRERHPEAPLSRYRGYGGGNGIPPPTELHATPRTHAHCLASMRTLGTG